MILIDSRVGSAEYLDPLVTALNGQAKSAFLNSGDFAWEGCHESGVVNVGVEIKQLSDLLASMRSGRYAEQITKMREDYHVCYLMIVGSYAPNNDGLLCTPVRGGWKPLSLSTKEQEMDKTRRRSFFTYSELDKFLASVECIENTIIRKASNRVDAIHQVANLYNWWQKPWDSHGSTKAVKFQSGLVTERASLCRMIAAQLPGIGWELAGRVERHFGNSTQRMINAGVEAWAEISWKSDSGRKNSVGPKRAAAIVKAIEGK